MTTAVPERAVLCIRTGRVIVYPPFFLAAIEIHAGMENLPAGH